LVRSAGNTLGRLSLSLPSSSEAKVNAVPCLARLQPTDIRGTGQGFCYNVGRPIGSEFMTAMDFATAVMPLGTAIMLFSTLAHALMIVNLLCCRRRAAGWLQSVGLWSKCANGQCAYIRKQCS